MYQEHLKKFEEKLKILAITYGKYTAFHDFVKLCAISIYNNFAKNQEMEQEYLRTINAYEKKYQQLFPEMFGELIMMYEHADTITDILGPFYEKETLSNSHIGQFFTPTAVSNLLAKITMDKEDIKKIIEKYGFISLSEPSCGAGGMILSYAKALQELDINYQQNLLVEATDISDICVYMTYIQLSLYGIPAIVYCGNTLTQETRFKMETPLFFLNYWKFRKFYTSNCKISNEVHEDSNEIIVEKNKN